MRQEIELVIYSTEPEQVAALQSRFSSEPNIHVIQANGIEATARFHLDAMWMPPMLASYYGVDPRLPPHVAKVFSMPEEKRKTGLPRWIIAGVALVPGKVYTREYLATICPRAMGEAIREHNETCTTPILSIGGNPGHLGLEDLTAFDALVAWRELFHSPIVPQDHAMANRRHSA